MAWSHTASSATAADTHRYSYKYDRIPPCPNNRLAYQAAKSKRCAGAHQVMPRPDHQVAESCCGLSAMWMPISCVRCCTE